MVPQETSWRGVLNVLTALVNCRVVFFFTFQKCLVTTCIFWEYILYNSLHTFK